MTISAISRSTSASPISNFQAFRQDFSQLTRALQSGDLSSAQSAYTTLSSSPLAQGNNPFAQAIQQIGQYLKDGDLADAQKALAALQQQMQTHGHHHHHGGAQAPRMRQTHPATRMLPIRIMTATRATTRASSTFRSPSHRARTTRSTSRPEPSAFVSCAGLTRASMMRRRMGRPYSLSTLQFIMDCRVKPGNDGDLGA